MQIIISVILLTFFAGILVTKNEGFDVFIMSPIQPLLFTEFKEAVHPNLWPNVLTTVAELKEGTVHDIINAFGGKPYFLIAIIGVVLILSKKIEKKEGIIFVIFSVLWLALLSIDSLLEIGTVKYLLLLAVPFVIGMILTTFRKIESAEGIDIQVAILLMIWIIAGIYASTKGVRFILLLAPVFGIAFGISISRIVDYFSKIITKELHLSKIISTTILLAIAALLFISPIRASYSDAKADIPLLNDAMHNGLILIKNNSTKSAIITSWWDFGHHFKAVADRSVTFDGATQTYATAHWVGNALLTSDEAVSVGILRMQNCGSINAFNELHNVINDTVKSVGLMYQVITKDEVSARKFLLYNGLTENVTQEVIKNTHCNPNENFLITSEDMVGKAPVWGHFGSWDFKRALVYQLLRNPENSDSESAIKYIEDRLNYSRVDAENIYFEIINLKSEDVNNWVSPWPIYSSIIQCGKLGNDTLKCGNFMINLSSYEGYLLHQSGKLFPKRIVFPVEDGYVKRDYNESIALLQNSRPLGLTVIPGKEYSVLQADYLLSDSIFTKLFYLEAHGLRNFRKFYEEPSILGGKVIIWKVDWNGNTSNDIFKNDSRS